MNAIEVFREALVWTHELLEMVTADVTSEQLQSIPPGVANPLGAIYAHAIIAEDGVVNALLRGATPLFAGEWAGRTGLSDPQWSLEFERARNLKMDLPAFRPYAQAVHASAIEYVASLSEEGLDRPIDLTAQGLGRRTIGWALSALVVSHLNNMIGEISCLKGIQGVRGYPF
ncbi:MAG TPA: DinB family protein [Anaerolineae bacterium]|nr:DinB family protein [Anaerolineae bacterium]